MNHYVETWTPVTGVIKTACGRSLPRGSHGIHLSLDYEIDCPACIQWYHQEYVPWLPDDARDPKLGMVGVAESSGPKEWIPQGVPIHRTDDL